MERAVTTAEFNDKTMGDIITELVKKAGMNADVKGADDHKKFILQRDMTDIQFIRDYAEKKNAAFIVKNGKFTFKPVKEMPSGADVILEYEKTLTEFDVYRESRDMCGSVETRGFDYSAYKSITKTLSGDTMSLKIGGEAVAPKTADNAYGKKISILTDLSVIDEKAAEARCDSALGEMSGKYMYISRRCQGNVLIHAGNNINIKNTGKSYSGIYFLTSVTHRLVPMRGYTVDFEGYRNALPSPPKIPPKDVQPQEEKKKEEGKLNPEFTNLAWKLDDKQTSDVMESESVILQAVCSHMGKQKSINVKVVKDGSDNKGQLIDEVKGKVLHGNKVEAKYIIPYIETSEEDKKQTELVYEIETLDGKYRSIVSPAVKYFEKPVKITVIIELPHPEDSSTIGQMGLSGHTALAIGEEFYDFGPDYHVDKDGDGNVDKDFAYLASQGSPWWDRDILKNEDLSKKYKLKTVDDVGFKQAKYYINHTKGIYEVWFVEIETTKQKAEEAKKWWKDRYNNLGEYSVLPMIGEQCTTTVRTSLVESKVIPWNTVQTPQGFLEYLKGFAINTAGRNKNKPVNSFMYKVFRF